MNQCKCGCQGETKGGDFLLGHDQKLRAAIEHAAGGIDNLRKIVEEKIGKSINANSE